MTDTVEKIDLPFFCQLGTAFTPLTKLDPGNIDRFHVWVAIYTLDQKVSQMFVIVPSLHVCRQKWSELRAMMQPFLPNQPINWANPWDAAEQWQLTQLQTKTGEFELVLMSELGTMATYHATQKGIYATPDLIDRAENLFPGSVLQKLSDEVRREVRESGRCLAFDNATASGFHAMRATESVMHDYYLAVCKPTPVPKRKLDSWGAYIAVLHKVEDEDVKRAVAILQQLKDHDRNVIVHPEVVLTPDDAFKLFEIAQGAILAMVDKLPEPGTAVAS
jgi:hypothetical protein